MPSTAAMEQQIQDLTLKLQALEAKQAAVVASDAPAKSPHPKSDGAGLLSLDGITVYGTLDVGAAYINHGAPLSAYHSVGLPFAVQKFSNRSMISVDQNGMSQSKLGVSGLKPITSDLSVVFKLETAFSPVSGNIPDGPRSLINNNGVAQNKQTMAGDSSRAGQLFQGGAYVGIDSKTFGSLIVGRQNSLLLDNMTKYDPQAMSGAFSLLGYSSFASGAGASESARFDSALKYAYSYGPARFAAIHQFGSAGTLPGSADEADVGIDYGAFSADATYTHLSDAVSESSLTAAQAAAAPGTLAATISDNTSYAIEGRYQWRKIRLYAGYESIEFANPSHPLAVGVAGIGGYKLSVVNNTAYAIHRVEQVSWVGARYSLTKALDLVAAYYRYDQNSYKAKSCSDNSASSCSGTQQDYTVSADYRFTKNFDVYAGLHASNVANGLASGYLQTSVVATAIGARFSF
jgi:predicted porin